MNKFLFSLATSVALIFSGSSQAEKKTCPNIKDVRATLADMMKQQDKFRGKDIFDLHPEWDSSLDCMEKIFRAYIAFPEDYVMPENMKPENTPSIQDYRAMFRQSLTELSYLKTPAPPLKEKKVSLGDIEFVKYDSNKDSPKVLLHLHGGGYLLRFEDTGGLYEDMFSRLIEGTNCTVYVPLYRVRPEHPIDASLEDAYKAYNALIENGISPENIILTGDSAGGGLALRLLLKLKQGNKAMPKKAILLSPWTDLSLSSPSFVENAGNDIFSDTTGLADLTAMIVGDNDPKDPMISPVYGDYSGFPKLIYVVAGPELFRDDTLRDVEKAKRQNVEVELIRHDDGVHVYPGSARFLKSGAKALNMIIEEIKR